MAKQKGFGNSLGDLLISAMGGDGKKVKKLVEDKPVSKTAGSVPKNEMQQPSSSVTGHKAQRPQTSKFPASARTISSPHKLIYNAGKRPSDELETDFASTDSFNKRKGILEGVTFCLNRLSEIRNPDLATRQRMVDLQELKRDFEGQLKQMKAGMLGQRNAVGVGRVTPEKAQKASPASEKKYVSLFSSKDQFGSTSDDATSCDVVIGLDFGTACTKVIVRTPDHFDSASFVVPFGMFGHPSNECLLPTHVSLANNHYSLPVLGAPGTYSDLKMHLIDSLSSINEGEAIDNAVAYLALVFRYVRTWFLREKVDAYEDFRLIWQVNIGIPSASSECDDLCHLYQKAAYIAWRFSLCEGDITYPGLLKVREQLHSDAELESQELITVFPEVAAEVAGYTQSDLRQEGLHLMVDIGAGTLDVCGFNVHRQNGNNFLPLFSTSVERQGVCMLHQTRRKAIEACLKDTFAKIMPEPATPLTNNCASYIPEKSRCEKALDTAEKAFFHSCAAQVYGVVRHLRTSMDPRSNRWNTNLPVFLCGGGSVMPQYRSLVGELSEWLKTNIGDCRARLLELPYPIHLKGKIKPDEYHRFAVAWGLSYRSFDIDQVITHVKPVQTPTKGGPDLPWYERGPDYLIDDY